MSFGGGSIEKALFDWIHSNIEDGNTILELGSGYGTKRLSEHYDMISIEHDKEWVDKYDSDYIYASLVDGWYDVDAIKNGLEDKEYDVVLIDGPNAHKPEIQDARQGFFYNRELFDLEEKAIIFDDVDRILDRKNYQMTMAETGGYGKVLKGDKKEFAILRT